MPTADGDRIEGVISALDSVPLSVLVEANREAWDHYGEPIDAKNVEAVREHAAKKVLEAVKEWLTFCGGRL